MGDRRNKRIGEVLIDLGAITEDQLNRALAYSGEKGIIIGDALLALGFVDEQTLFKGLSYIFRVPYVNFEETSIEKEAVLLISEQLAKKYGVIPIRKEGETLVLAMHDPVDFYAIDDVEGATGMEVSAVITPKKDILNAIDRYYGSEIAEQAFEDLKREYSNINLESLADISASAVESAPVVRLINSILQNAIKSGASDIHIEPMAKNLKIRFRIDGQLQELMNSSMMAHSAIITRIKIMGNMDIAEKRLPQDGRVSRLIIFLPKQQAIKSAALKSAQGRKNQ